MSRITWHSISFAWQKRTLSSKKKRWETRGPFLHIETPLIEPLDSTLWRSPWRPIAHKRNMYRDNESPWSNPLPSFSVAPTQHFWRHVDVRHVLDTTRTSTIRETPMSEQCLFFFFFFFRFSNTGPMWLRWVQHASSEKKNHKFWQMDSPIPLILWYNLKH